MKDNVTAYILCLTLGIFGAHKFYLNNNKIGLLYLSSSLALPVLIQIMGLSFNVCFITPIIAIPAIGTFIDLFTLPQQVKNANRSIINNSSKDKSTFFPMKNAKLSESEKEKIILLLAKKHNGKLTPLEIAAETDINIDDAEKLLKKWTDKGYADVNISPDGTVLYKFRGFLSEDDKNNSSGVF